MSNPASSEFQSNNEADESFKDILSQFERTKTRKPTEAGKGREGTVIAVTPIPS